MAGSGLSNTTLAGATVNVTGVAYSGAGTWAATGGGSYRTASGGGLGNFTTDGNALNTTTFANAALPGVDGALSVNDTATFGANLGSGTVLLNGASPSLNVVAFTGGTSGTIAPGTGGTLTLRNNGSAVAPSGQRERQLHADDHGQCRPPE